VRGLGRGSSRAGEGPGHSGGDSHGDGSGCGGQNRRRGRRVAARRRERRWRHGRGAAGGDEKCEEWEGRGESMNLVSRASLPFAAAWVDVHDRGLKAGCWDVKSALHVFHWRVCMLLRVCILRRALTVGQGGKRREAEGYRPLGDRGI